MTTANNIIKGLKILAKHCEDGLDGLGVWAEHDVLFAGPDYRSGKLLAMPEPEEFPEDDKTELKKLGWHISRESGEKTWARFT